MRRILILAVVIVIAVGAVAFGRYTYWVLNWSNAEAPFDEVGISLHKMMPGFVQDWGCAQLKAEFSDKTVPPYGCRAAEGRDWR
ncbi:MAG: hypothetical protein ACK5M4_15560 [Pseudorhodobacter sp.]